jgi:ABC-type polysaccharide/polyol phosphate transport system ATPase subunit
VKILVLATHDPTIMESLCSRIVWLHHGEIREVGPFKEIYPKYLAAIG